MNAKSVKSNLQQPQVSKNFPYIREGRDQKWTSDNAVITVRSQFHLQEPALHSQNGSL